MSQMKVCWAGTFDPSFERNRRLREYLDTAPVSYQVIRADLWPDDRLESFQKGKAQILLKMAWLMPWLIFRLWRASKPDLYLVSYPGWLDVIVVGFVARIRRRPIVYDIFISLHETVVEDRGLVASDSTTAGMLRRFDRLAVRAADLVIVDCETHARYLAMLAGCSIERFRVLYIGSDETVFTPADEKLEIPKLVVFYGTFVPLQGVDVIVEAAAKVQDPNVRFRIIGDGQTRPNAIALARHLEVRSIEFVDVMPKAELAGELHRASLCLGIFGVTGKSNRVIPHKVFDAISCGKAVLTGETEAIREIFKSGEVAVCEVGNSGELAREVDRLVNDDHERHRLGSAARDLFEREFSAAPQSDRLSRFLYEAVNCHRARHS